MRKKEINGIINDLLDLASYKNPIHNIFIKEKVTFNLLTGEHNIIEGVSLFELLKEKRDWFLKKIKSLNGNIKDFEKATIAIYGKEEKVEIAYKGEKFSKSFVVGA